MGESALSELWRERLDSFAREGTSIRAWCARHGVPEPQFYDWRRRLAALGAVGKQSTAKANGKWCPVELAPEPAPVAKAPGGLVLRVGQVTIEVQPGFDAGMLRAVVRALEAA
jgi:hypothetical protein